MRQWKLYLIIVPSLVFLLFATMASCSQPPATIENQPVSQKPAEFEVGPITFEPATVMVGDLFTATATVKNTGDIAGTYTATLSVNGQQVDSKVIPVDPGDSQQTSFQLSKINAGNYQIAIGNSSTVLTVYNWSSYTIQYDGADGATVGAYVDGEQGHIIHFTPPNRAFKIQKIRIFGMTRIKTTSELDNRITVRIWDKEGNNQLWSQDFPWRLFLGGSWQDVKVPDVRVNDDFQVEVVTHSSAQGDPIDFVSMTGIVLPGVDVAGVVINFPWPVGGDVQSAVLIGCNYPPSYIDSPYHPTTRSGYSYMGKLIDPGQKRLEGIQWLIRVEGEGAPDN
jgi:hypothetical protein